MVALRVSNFATAPPTVSIPIDSGITSSNKTSLRVPCKTDACAAAPRATTQSGSSAVYGSNPKNSPTRLRTRGILVEPPTRMTRSMAIPPASRSARSHARIVRSMNGLAMASNSARESVLCIRTPLPKSISICVLSRCDKAIFADSAKSRRACRAPAATLKFSFADDAIPASFSSCCASA